MMALRSNGGKGLGGETFCSYRDSNSRKEEDRGLESPSTSVHELMSVAASNSRGEIRTAADKIKRMAKTSATKLGMSMKVRNTTRMEELQPDAKTDTQAVQDRPSSVSSSAAELLQCGMADRMRDYTRMDNLRYELTLRRDLLFGIQAWMAPSVSAKCGP